MNLRTALASASALVALTVASPARADDEAPPQVAFASPVKLSLSTGEAMKLAERSVPAGLRATGPFGPMTEVRLSQGAKTAIIVGAIVVGVLIIVGVVAVAEPGKKIR